jgi:hypothetical protein
MAKKDYRLSPKERRDLDYSLDLRARAISRRPISKEIAAEEGREEREAIKKLSSLLGERDLPLKALRALVRGACDREALELLLSLLLNDAAEYYSLMGEGEDYPSRPIAPSPPGAFTLLP